MILERFVTGRARSNTYVFAPADDRCVIVDPGVGAARKVGDFMSARGLGAEMVLLTHGHPDHVWSARALSDAYSIPVMLHPSDWVWLDDPACGGVLPLVTLAGRAVGRACRLRPSRLRPTGEEIEAAGARFSVVHTPGHTPGGVCYVTDDVCFTGDTLFAGGVGHTTYPGGSRGTLQRSVAGLLSLDDDVRLFPGHGPQTTMARARPMLESLSSQRR